MDGFCGLIAAGSACPGAIFLLEFVGGGVVLEGAWVKASPASNASVREMLHARTKRLRALR